MKRKGWAVVIAAAVLLVAAVPPARAQFYIGVRGGLSNQDVTRQDGVPEIKFDKDSAFLYGGQIGFRLSLLSIEGEYYRADHNLLASDSSIPSTGVEMDYSFLGVNVRLGIPLVIVYPYVTVGYGQYSADLTGFGEDSDTAFNAGAGVEVKLGMVGLFGELRYKDFSFEIDNLKWDFKGTELHFGLNIHF